MILYNDNEPFVCDWLRNLIDAGHLPQGEVVDTPIQELKPDSIPATFHTFAGIGGWPLALRMAGWPDDQPVWTGSCPCQPFSSAGKRKGTDDERHLWPAFRDLIAECRPPVVFGEQVASKAGREWLAGVRADLEALGYAVGAADLCAAGVGAPHIRQRLYWVADSTGKRFDGITSAAWQGCGHGIENGCGDSNRVADASCERVRAIAGGHGEAAEEDGRPTRQRQRVRPDGRDGVSDSDGLERTIGNCDFCGFVFDQELLGRYGCPNCCGDGLGNADDPRCLEQRRAEPVGEKQLSAQCAGRNYWDTAGLVRCVEPTKDGGTITKYRRAPLEPSLFPLADGVPGRVGLLRGAGNAIVPQVAAAFVRAYMETLGGRLSEMKEVAG